MIIYKSIVATYPSVWISLLGAILAANTRLHLCFGAVGEDLGADSVTTFEEVKHDGLSTGSTTSLATNAFSSGVGLVNFEFAREWQLSRLDLSHRSADSPLSCDSPWPQIVYNSPALAKREVYRYGQ